MNNSVRRLAVALVALSPALLAAPALAQPAAEGPVTHTDQLVVVTPNAPIVITNGAPGAQAPAAAPGAIAPQPATGAPQNEDWNNVSHINGTLVKVGEKTDYMLTYKKVNLSTNPIGWMFGFYGVSASYALGANVAVRGDVNFMSLDNGNTTGYEIGASLPIYFKRVYSGPFIEPGLISRGLSERSYCDTVNGGSCPNSTSTLIGPEVLFGWHWTFDSGLNVAMAFGAARNMNKDSMSYGSDVEPAGYFRVGYAF